MSRETWATVIAACLLVGVILRAILAPETPAEYEARVLADVNRYYGAK